MLKGFKACSINVAVKHVAKASENSQRVTQVLAICTRFVVGQTEIENLNWANVLGAPTEVCCTAGIVLRQQQVQIVEAVHVDIIPGTIFWLLYP